MYQKYSQIVEGSNTRSLKIDQVYEKLYERKQEYALMSLEELGKCESKLEAAKNDMKVGQLEIDNYR